MTLPPGVWFGAAAFPWITEIRHYSGEYGSSRCFRRQEAFYIFHHEDERLKAGNDPQIFEIEKIPVIAIRAVLVAFFALIPRTPDQRVGLTGGAPQQYALVPSQSVPDSFIDSSVLPLFT